MVATAKITTRSRSIVAGTAGSKVGLGLMLQIKCGSTSIAWLWLLGPGSVWARSLRLAEASNGLYLHE